MSLFNDLYEVQKKVFRDLQASVEGDARDLVDKVYKDQKDIIKAVQEEAIEEGKKLYNTNVNILYDRIVDSVRSSGFIGKLVARFLEAYKNKLIGKLILE